MMYRCAGCSGILSDDDLTRITVDGKVHYVCPECLAELLNTDLEELSPAEEKEIRDEWDADERYDEMMLGREAR